MDVLDNANVGVVTRVGREGMFAVGEGNFGTSVATGDFAGGATVAVGELGEQAPITRTVTNTAILRKQFVLIMRQISLFLAVSSSWIKALPGWFAIDNFRPAGIGRISSIHSHQ